MKGEKDIKSKAIALGLLEIAIIHQRNFVAVFFGSKYDPLKVVKISKNKKEDYFSCINDIATYFLGGGTDFEYPLSRSIKILEEDEYLDGDIVFITDGFCRVSDHFLSDYFDLKEKHRFSTFSVLIDALDVYNREHQKQEVERFSDSVFFSENFIDSEKGAFNDDLKIVEQLYSLF